MFVPPLPPKQYLGTGEAEFLKKRMSELERFMQRVIEVPVFRDSIVLQRFVQVEYSGFDQVKKELGIEAERFNVLEVYQKRYSDLIFKFQTSPLGAEYFERVKKYLAETKVLCAKSKEFGETMAIKFKEFNVALVGFNENVWKVQKAPEVGDVIQPDKANSFPKRSDASTYYLHWAELNNQLSVQYDASIRDLSRFEFDDIETLIEILERRNSIASQHAKAEKDASKWENTNPANDKQRDAKEKDLANEMRLRNLNQAVSAVFAFNELPQLFEYHNLAFNRNLVEFSESQIGTLTLVSNLS
jgi:hypothetical protein